MRKTNERSPSFLSGLFCFNMGGFPTFNYPTSNSISDDTLYRSQSDIIRDLYDRGPCVIVGRTADYVLRDRENVFNIFVHAPEDECVKRILARGEITDLRRHATKLAAPTVSALPTTTSIPTRNGATRHHIISQSIHHFFRYHVRQNHRRRHT